MRWSHFCSARSWWFVRHEGGSSPTARTSTWACRRLRTNRTCRCFSSPLRFVGRDFLRRLAVKLKLASLLVLAIFTGRVQADDSFTITPDVVYGHKAGMAMTFDVIRPAKQNGPAVLFMVSGGWYSFWVPAESLMRPEPPLGLTYIRELVDKGYTLFIVRHGSAPQFKVPEAVADVRRAVRYIRANAEKFGIDPKRIGVCGGSA